MIKQKIQKILFILRGYSILISYERKTTPQFKQHILYSGKQCFFNILFTCFLCNTRQLKDIRVFHHINVKLAFCRGKLLGEIG